MPIRIRCGAKHYNLILHKVEPPIYIRVHFFKWTLIIRPTFSNFISSARHQDLCSLTETKSNCTTTAFWLSLRSSGRNGTCRWKSLITPFLYSKKSLSITLSPTNILCTGCFIAIKATTLLASVWMQSKWGSSLHCFERWSRNYCRLSLTVTTWLWPICMSFCCCWTAITPRCSTCPCAFRWTITLSGTRNCWRKISVNTFG